MSDESRTKTARIEYVPARPYRRPNTADPRPDPPPPPPPATAAEARALTEQIRTRAVDLLELIGRAYTTRVWVALDYGSWDEYVARELDSTQLRLPREKRTQVIGSLRDLGMPLRAIASATGTSRGTVARDLARVPNGTPDSVPGPPDEPPDEPPARTLTVVPRSDPDTVTGRDGKVYRRRRPAKVTVKLPAGPDAAVVEDLIRYLAALQLRIGVAELDAAVTPAQAARLLVEVNRHTAGLQRLVELLTARATVEGGDPSG